MSKKRHIDILFFYPAQWRTMKTILQPYRKIALLIMVGFGLLAAQPVRGGLPSGSPLAALLAAVPQSNTYPEMDARLISYADYRALERASGIAPILNRDAYLRLDAPTRAAWWNARARLIGGANGFINLAEARIQQMPELLGVDFFEVDQSLVYGAEPFLGTLIHSEQGDFAAWHVGRALRMRGFDPLPYNDAWALGGDGQTDINALAFGDPFGGDVGLSSRIAVLNPHLIVNSFLTVILEDARRAHDDQLPAVIEQAEVALMAEALTIPDGELIQALIVNSQAGERQAAADDRLPPYLLAAIADLQHTDTEILRVVWILPNTPHTYGLIADGDTALRGYDAAGWLDTLGYTLDGQMQAARGGFLVVTLDYKRTLTADSPYPAATVFGFWARAIQTRMFAPFAQ